MTRMKSQKEIELSSRKRKSPRLSNGIPQKPTREKIIEAALQVFADYPYYAASIRMIGKAANIDHPLISYYFPTKAALFEEVLKTVTEEYYQANTAWFDGLEKLDPESGLSSYLDRFFEFALMHPKALRIIALNFVQAEEAEIIPGYQHIQTFFSKTMGTFIRTVPLQGLKRDIEFFTHSFNTLAINYLAGHNYYASILGLEPGGSAYLKWVKESLIFLFLPRLRQIINGENKE
jgi:TetR/AcrR family transcriptional regulator